MESSSDYSQFALIKKKNWPEKWNRIVKNSSVLIFFFFSKVLCEHQAMRHRLSLSFRITAFHKADDITHLHQQTTTAAGMQKW